MLKKSVFHVLLSHVKTLSKCGDEVQNNISENISVFPAKSPKIFKYIHLTFFCVCFIVVNGKYFTVIPQSQKSGKEIEIYQGLALVSLGF